MQVSVRPVSAVDAFPMRRYLLRPMLPASESRYKGDDHPQAIHLAAFADLGDGEEMLGVVSFLPQDEEGMTSTAVYQLQGMVTVPAVRRAGIGERLARHGLELLRKKGVTRVWCNGRTPATSFYERLGFRTVGHEFMTPGTGPHFRFVHDLA